MQANSLPSIRTLAPPSLVLDRADLRNLGLLIVWMVCLLVVVPLGRAFPILDDWIYAQSVRDLLNGSYSPHDWAQASSLGLVVWGAVLSLGLGFSFTTLAIASLAMAGACAVLLYLLLRQLDIVPEHALLGTALLVCNPLFVYLSYSFMTDVTFLAYMLLASVCYVRGLKGHGTAWLWAGSAAASLALLTRQFGVLLVAALLLYLWWSRRLTVRSTLAGSAIPVACFIAYLLWSSAQPPTLVSIATEQARALAISDPLDYLMGRLQRLGWILPIVGLSLLPLLRVPRKVTLVAALFCVIMLLQLRGLLLAGTFFPDSGNVLNVSGFLMFDYNAAPIWNIQVWTLLAVAGALACAMLCAAIWYRSVGWVRSGGWKAGDGKDPSALVYITGALMAGSAIVASPLLFDRYLMPLLPALILLSLKALDNANHRVMVRWLALAPIALFALLAQHDFSSHSAARWQAAEGLAAQGVARNRISAGFEWSGWYLYNDGAALTRASREPVDIRFPANAALDPAFLLSDLPVEGYEKIDSVPYMSWLNGGAMRHVLVLERR